MTEPVKEEKSSSRWYLYIIQTYSGNLYTGITTDWQRRFNEHSSNSKKSAKALRGKGPLKMVFCAEVASHSAALKAEIWVKKQTKANKIKLINKSSTTAFSFVPVDFSGLGLDFT